MPHRKNDVHTWCISIYHVIGLKQTLGIKNVNLKVAIKICGYHSLLQGSYGSWKTRKVLEFYYGIFQDWKVLEKGHGSWKVLVIC